MTAVFAGKGTVEPHLMVTSLIRVTWLLWPNFSSPLVTVLMGFHCTMKTVMCDINNTQRGIIQSCHDYLKSFYSMGYSIHVQ